MMPTDDDNAQTQNASNQQRTSVLLTKLPWWTLVVAVVAVIAAVQGAMYVVDHARPNPSQQAVSTSAAQPPPAPVQKQAPQPVTIEIGDVISRNGEAVGDPVAVRRLVSALHAYPAAQEFIVTWTSVYPSGGRYGNVITYQRSTNTLVLSFPASPTTYTYSGVTDKMLRSLANEKQRYISINLLPEYGCTENCE